MSHSLHRRLTLPVALTATWLALAATWLALTAPGAAAAGLSAPVADCNAHGTLTQTYSVSQLRSALATMPADIAEYTDCHDVIENQLLGLLGGLHGGGPGAGGGAFIPAPVAAMLILLGLIGSGYAGLAVRQRRGGPSPAVSVGDPPASPTL
jgi:hypothetical protein